MKEIKFRAYDKAYERMFTTEILQQASDGMVAAANERLNQEKRFDNYNRCPGGFFIPTKDENMEIMQYTGLKDKNGKEIYEGDIVELTDEGRQIYGTKEHPSRKYQLVGFKDGGFMTGRNDIDCEFLDTYLWILKDYITVVGNKFDNPELLEKGE